eukprot:360329-Chlamydomonas_euryale.AAC.8
MAVAALRPVLVPAGGMRLVWGGLRPRTMAFPSWRRPARCLILCLSALLLPTQAYPVWACSLCGSSMSHALCEHVLE